MTEELPIGEDEPVENFLTEDEQAVFFTWTEAQQEHYLAAQESYEAMKAYLEDSETPEEAKALLDLDGWK
ncbi:hypothetical protein [Neisseria iguanae]|uniref:Uncharacterized protein n=1 Tax=Neisseria iguanae TaxID=90242 RepID=A0A2P7U169_9NEIS|nr:hypothetical protein [Neisseria iguanae]PSJ80653.1 hypothetical protein C7N83_05065 [Neisseria iguanae]